MQPAQRHNLRWTGQPALPMATPFRIDPEELENLAYRHERITEPFAHMIDHLWALRGRDARTQLERFGLIADVPVAEIGRALGITRQAIKKQQLLLEAERGGYRDEKSLSRKVDYEWALTGTRPDTQLLRFYIVTPLPTFAIRRGWRLSVLTISGLGVTKQAISRQRKLWSDYRRENGLKPAMEKKQASSQRRSRRV
jgi:hypothetical protein